MKNFIIVFVLITSSLFAQEYGHICADSKIKHFTKLNKLNKINYPGDDRIDVTYYKLDLRIFYTVRTINGTVTINAKSLEDNLNNVFFDLQDHFTLGSVSLNGNILAATLNNDKINITLDRAYNTDEEFSIEISYSGTPGSSGFGSFEYGEHGEIGNSQPAIWTLSEPYGSSDWWPSKDTPADKADSSDVWVRSDDFFVTVSNGKLIDEIDHGDGTKTYKWKNSYPIAHYLISLAMTNYAIYKNNFEYGDGNVMEVIHYNYPENFNLDRFRQLDRTVNMLEVFTDLFGPYPFLDEKYGHAEFGWGGGMEHQTVSSMGSYGEGIVSHELAHQWFGDKITCKDWQNIWLNEGFATYSEVLFAEAAYGDAAYKSYMEYEMSQAINAIGSIYVQDISKISEIFNGDRSYAKGAVILHMLRKVVGDDNFFYILKTYAAHPDLAYNVATTEDFQAICEEVSGIDLNYFFNEWIYGENHPKYSVNWNYSNLSGDSYLVNVNISQQQQTNPSFFTMPIDLMISTNLGDTVITIFNNEIDQDFNFTVIGLPEELLIDPNNWILKEIINVTTDLSNQQELPNEFSLSQNYPNPFNPVTTIQYSIPQSDKINSSAVKLNVYNIQGQEVINLVNENKNVGFYEVKFDASFLPSGIYYYRLEVENYSNTKKMILLK